MAQGVQCLRGKCKACQVIFYFSSVSCFFLNSMVRVISPHGYPITFEAHRINHIHNLLPTPKPCTPFLSRWQNWEGSCWGLCICSPEPSMCPLPGALFLIILFWSLDRDMIQHSSIFIKALTFFLHNSQSHLEFGTHAKIKLLVKCFRYIMILTTVSCHKFYSFVAMKSNYVNRDHNSSIFMLESVLLYFIIKLYTLHISWETISFSIVLLRREKAEFNYVLIQVLASDSCHRSHCWTLKQFESSTSYAFVTLWKDTDNFDISEYIKLKFLLHQPV